MTLEARVLDYINHHPEGVRISEMETPLGVTRIRLGFVTKILLDEGKIVRIENSYYPNQNRKNAGPKHSQSP
ncbi:MAG: hypothetical protein WCJ95_03385 [Mariniphaga sp.]